MKQIVNIMDINKENRTHGGGSHRLSCETFIDYYYTDV